MKFNKFFIGTMLAVACTMAFTACEKGGDDPFGPNPDPNPDPTTNALTVAEAIAKGNDGSEQTVKGYIVGWFNNKPNPGVCEFGNVATDTTVSKTNVLIADAANETNSANVVCVQLPAGAVRSLVNLGETPSNLGKEVTVKGLLSTYNGLPGVKTTSFAQIGTKTSDDYAAQFYCYRVGIGSLDANTVAAMKAGDKVVITAQIVNYKGTTPETVLKTGTIISINGTAPAEAITAAQAIAAAKALGPDVPSTETYTIAGEVTQITENAATTTYKNMTFYIK